MRPTASTAPWPPAPPPTPPPGAQSEAGLRFTVVNKEDPAQRVAVRYRGTVPDQFKAGREVVVTGRVEGGTFVARNDSLITLCPSKFTDQPGDSAT